MFAPSPLVSPNPVCARVYACLRVCARMRACMRTRVHVCACVCACLRACVLLCFARVSASSCLHTIRASARPGRHARLGQWTSGGNRSRISTHTHTHTHTYIHTHTHTHTHTHLQRPRWGGAREDSLGAALDSSGIARPGSCGCERRAPAHNTVGTHMIALTAQWRTQAAPPLLRNAQSARLPRAAR